MDATLKRWDELSLALKSDGTAKVYMRQVKRFLKIRRVEASEAAGWDARRAEEEMRRYIGAGKRNGTAPKTLNLIWFALLDFFATLGIKVDCKLPLTNVANVHRDMGLNKGNVHRVLERSPLYVKLGIALEAFSGLRPSDAVHLCFGDFEPDLSRGVEPVMLFIGQDKTSNPYVTFVPPQTIRYLEAWRAVREQSGETITAETRVLTWSESKNMSSKIGSWLRRSGIEVRRGFRLRNYAFRKYFRRQMMGVVDESLAEFFMGHKTALYGVYTQLADLDPEAIKKAREEYRRAIPELQTDGFATLKDLQEVTNELKAVHKENAMLRVRLDRLNGFLGITRDMTIEDVDKAAYLLKKIIEERHIKDQQELDEQEIEEQEQLTYLMKKGKLGARRKKSN